MAKPAADVDYKLRVGDGVIVKRENPLGNPRTPMYVRGRRGVVVASHGVISNPLDHRGLYPPLYTVAFDVNEVFGGHSDEKLWVDIHEGWLEKAESDQP